MDITTPINSDKDLADKVEFFIYNKWNIPNTDILKFIKMLENKNSAYIVDAIIKVNELKNVNINCLGNTVITIQFSSVQWLSRV